ncbi:MAG: hypothetical protein ACYDA6_00385 [Solirubrobacteraceae bacterium]
MTLGVIPRRAKAARPAVLLDTPGAWRVAVLGICGAAFAARLAVIGHSHGGEDLRMYVYFSRVALHGLNPYSAHPHALFVVSDGNNTPLEVAAFAGMLAIHDSPTTLRLLFALADVAVLALVGLRLRRTRAWRAAFMAFYAFNPFVLISWTAFAEDKTILFLGIVVWLMALEDDLGWGAWMVTAALAVFKFLGAFAVPAQAVHSWREHRRSAVAPIVVFAGVFVIGSLPWLPQSLDAFTRRDARLALDPPIHASVMIVVSRLGLYSPIEARVLPIIGISAVLALFVARRMDIREAVVWSVFAGYIFLPDDDFGRLLLISLAAMLILHPSRRQWLALWATTCVEALAVLLIQHAEPHSLRGLLSPLRSLLGSESTLQHALWMNLLPALVVGLYITRRRGGGTALAGSPQAPLQPPTALPQDAAIGGPS